MDDDLRPWAIDGGVARDLADLIDWRPADGMGALAAAMPRFLPMGSTAKLAAIRADEVPPGADAEASARRVLEHGLARAAGVAGGAPSPSWSCWVACSTMAALVDWADVGAVHVASTRRNDADAPIVDFHAEVVVEVDGSTWICDPYFGVAVALPASVGDRSSAGDVLGSASGQRTVDGGWTLGVRLPMWDFELRFRRFGPALDHDDVRAMAAISTTHSGVPLRPYARLHLGESIVDASQSAEGTGVVNTWTASAGRVELALPSWGGAVDEFASQTGTRIV